MVKQCKQVILIALLFVIFTGAHVFAASFEASIDRNEVVAGESFRLEFSLSGTSAKSDPDFSSLKKDFTIVSRGQSSQTTIINGRSSSSISWQLTLIAPKDGKYTIPSVNIDTDAGMLKSKALSLRVRKASDLSLQAVGNTPIRNLSVSAKVDKRTIYQNEPVLYTVKLIAARNIANFGVSEFNVKDAVVEKQGDAKVYGAKLHGQPVKVIEARYLITPLKSGRLTIPAFVFKGQVESAVQRRRIGSLFDDSFFGMNDPFSVFDNLTNYEPFAVASEEISLDVKAPAVSMDPWLPLSSLKISDHLEGAENVKEGEPFTLSFTVVAEGAVGSVIPSLESQVMADGDFKVYADKPEIGENISDDSKSVTGWREEHYTLIPKKSGILTLPEIKIPWWNVNENKISYAVVAARKINVMAGDDSVKHAGESINNLEKRATKNQITQDNVSKKNMQSVSLDIKQEVDSLSYMYIILGIAGALIFVLSGAVIYLWRRDSSRESRGAASEGKKKNGKDKSGDKISLTAIKGSKTMEELKSNLQIFVSQRWGTPRNISLMSIYDLLKKEYPEIVSDKDKKLFSDLDAALYAGGNVDFEDIKKRIYGFLKSVKSDRVRRGKSANFTEDINPS